MSWTIHDQARRATLMRRAQLLAAASVTYNLAEAAIAILAGRAADSASLVGFGLDSLVEVSSGLVILWQFHHRVPESRERVAQRLIAVSFFALAAYLLYDAGGALLTGQQPDSSPVGIGLAVASLLIMPLLSVAQRRTGRELGSAAVQGDGTQTLLCAYLSGVLLVGLVLNATLGWSWADPIAALVIAAVAAKEGWQNWRGDQCCAPAARISLTEDRGTTLAATSPGPDPYCDTCLAPAPSPEEQWSSASPQANAARSPGQHPRRT